MITYVIQDLTGLFHIIQADSKKSKVQVYADWVFSNTSLECYAIDINDLQSKLKEMQVDKIFFYSCKDGFIKLN